MFDYSKKLIDVAQTKADEYNYSIKVLHGDARNTDLPGSSFDHVIIMGNSLGYIQAPDADSKIIKEAYRTIRPGGRLLVDVADGNVVENAFNPNSWHEIGERTVVCRHRELQDKIIKARELVIDKQKGLIRDKTYAMRLFNAESLDVLFQQSGFTDIKIYTNFSPHSSDGDYGFMNNRMIAVGRKA